MKELSLNILDIAENSVKAGATLTEIEISETDETLKITIRDNGCGMTEEKVAAAEDPFYTTRTTRKVGMGIPLFKMEAEMTGGSFSLTSKCREAYPDSHGTVVTAVFMKRHIDFTPLGDIVSTVLTLIQGHPETDFRFLHKNAEKTVLLDTRELRNVLEDVPLNSFEVIEWIKQYLIEQYGG